jgi:hypothetical protein
MRFGVAVLLAACGHAPPPSRAAPAPEETVTFSCPRYVYKIMTTALHAGPRTPADDALDVAGRDFDAAVAADEAGRPREAAQHFLDCARRFAAVRPDDPLVDPTVEAAQICYYDALYAFANAHAVADGKAALRAAAAADPRNAAYVERELADAPTECR